MKKAGDKELDHIFNKALGDAANAEYREADWNALELMLDKQKKRGGLVFWLPVLSSAAIFLVVFGWWMLRPDAIVHQHQKPMQQIAAHHPENYPAASKIDSAGKVAGTSKTEIAARGKVNLPRHYGQANAGDTALIAEKNLTDNASFGAENIAANKKGSGDIAGRGNAGLRMDDKALVAYEPAIHIADNATQLGVNTPDIPVASIAAAPGKSANKQSKGLTTSGFFVHPQYALSVMGAPEVNGINSLSHGRSGTNIGLLFSVGVLKKLTLSTGAMYATMPYNAYNASYASSHVNSAVTSIDADCRVLDIPINLDYQLYSRHQNKFSIGSGLSSYIMLHESYRFNYNDPSVYGPSNYTVPRDNKYALSILNLQATYTRQVTSNVGISLQPYMKLPLTGIGVYQGKLQSSGLAVGLSWNINSASKP